MPLRPGHEKIIERLRAAPLAVKDFADAGCESIGSLKSSVSQLRRLGYQIDCDNVPQAGAAKAGRTPGAYRLMAEPR